jgi:RimJ/RimL family protein N-acetyltransferase
MKNGHRLLTERLQLRWLTLDDAGLMLAVWNDPAFVSYVGDLGIRTAEQARDALKDGALKLYEDYGFGPFRVAVQSDDTPIGICGLFCRDGLEEPDIGFALLPEFCSKGYAYEAACAVMEHVRNDLALTRVIAVVSPENAASIRLLKKLGLQYESMLRLPEDGQDICLYAIDFPDQE